MTPVLQGVPGEGRSLSVFAGSGVAVLQVCKGTSVLTCLRTLKPPKMKRMETMPGHACHGRDRGPFGIPGWPAGASGGKLTLAKLFQGSASLQPAIRAQIPGEPAFHSLPG